MRNIFLCWLINNHIGAQHEHFQTFDEYLCDIARYQQQEILILLRQDKRGDHSAFGIAPGAEAGATGGKTGDIGGELPVQEFGRVRALYADWREKNG